MSYVLKSYIVSGEITSPIYFKAWDKTHKPLTAEKYNEARHWADKTNCLRFLKRNQVDLRDFECHRVIEDRYCQFCGSLLDPDTRLTKEFCKDKCRYDHHNKLS
jgi:hypothetical protein